VKEQEARLESLKVNDRVTINTGASYGYSTGSDVDSENSYSVSATGSKTLYDSGKNRLNKSAQKIAIEQANDGETDTRLSVVTNVKRAYYDLLLAQRNLEVAQDQLLNLRDHLETAKGYYEVGARPLIDVTKAEVDVANARVSALSAEAKVKLAYESLFAAMGDMELDPFGLTTPLEAPELRADASRMTELALAARPDYLKAMLAVSAADIRIQSAARSSAPTVSLNAGGTYGGRAFPLEDTFSAGVRVDFPVYDAGERDAAIEIARAQRTQAEAARELIAQNIVYEVRQAVLDLENAYARIQAASEALEYARENLDLAQGRYSTGVGSPLEVSDAVSDLSQARFTHYQAIYDAQAAVVSLEKAAGTNFVP
jgi:outer membrane protein TolC